VTAAGPPLLLACGQPATGQPQPAAPVAADDGVTGGGSCWSAETAVDIVPVPVGFERATARAKAIGAKTGDSSGADGGGKGGG